MTTTQMKTPLNPRPYINELVGKKILVRLKWGMTYTGKIWLIGLVSFVFGSILGFLVSVDQYMNVQLDKAVEFIDDQNKGPLGEILIRCNNILYISGIEEAGDDDDAMAWTKEIHLKNFLVVIVCFISFFLYTFWCVCRWSTCHHS